jgi:hypothetical protein
MARTLHFLTPIPEVAMRNYAAVLVAAALLSGCGGGGSGGGSAITIRCDFAGDMCEDITAVLTAAQQTSLQTSCTNALGTFAVGTCSTAGTVAGHCHYTGTAVLGGNVAGATANEYYYTAAWTVSTAQAYCASPPAGTWVP